MTRDLQSNIDFNAAFHYITKMILSSMKMLDWRLSKIRSLKSRASRTIFSIDGKVSGKAIAITTKKSGGSSRASVATSSVAVAKTKRAAVVAAAAV